MTYTPDHVLQVNQSVSLKIEQKREINCGFGQCDWRLKIYVNQNKDKVNSHPKAYTNVKCFLGHQNFQPAQVIVLQAYYGPLSEYTYVQPNNVIEEIPYEWPPYHGYMSFQIQRFNDKVYDTNNTVLNIRLGILFFLALSLPASRSLASVANYDRAYLRKQSISETLIYVF